MKQAKPTSQNRNLIVILSVLATLLLVAVVGYFAYDTYMDRQDKQRFETVRSSVKVLHSRLQRAAAPGVEWQMRTFCSQGSVKFQEALKGCDVVADTEIPVTSDEQATQLIEKYKSVFRSSGRFAFEGEGSPPRPINFPANLKNGYDGASFKERKTGMPCSSFFMIDGDSQKDVNDRFLEMRFSCSDYSRELHYPEQTLEQIIENS